jgi:hypothetical protein
MDTWLLAMDTLNYSLIKRILAMDTCNCPWFRFKHQKAAFILAMDTCISSFGPFIAISSFDHAAPRENQ